MLDKIKNWWKENWRGFAVIFTGVIMFVSVFLSIGYRIHRDINAKLDTFQYPYSMTVQHKENILHLQQIEYNLTEEVEKYINSIASTSCLNALTIVEACDEYDIDIIFVLAQGQIESHYGTKGIAAKTNSVFNVHSFDGVSAEQIKQSGKGYKHPDFSVRPYLDLLQRRYLVDGKTERDMFNSFVDADGKRYASAENYEQSLMNTYLKIAAETKLDSLQSEYRKYKIITYQ